MNEEWKAVAGYEGTYEVSNRGGVRRIKKSKGRIGDLKPQLNGHGYLHVILCNGKGRKVITLHKMVAEAFIGARPLGHEVNHKDCNRQNNVVSNLEYVTPQENTHHSHRLGRMKAWAQGERSRNAKLTDEQAKFILSQRGRKSMRALAADFGVHLVTVGDLMRGVTWKHLHQPQERTNATT